MSRPLSPTLAGNERRLVFTSSQAALSTWASRWRPSAAGRTQGTSAATAPPVASVASPAPSSTSFITSMSHESTTHQADLGAATPGSPEAADAQEARRPNFSRRRR